MTTLSFARLLAGLAIALANGWLLVDLLLPARDRSGGVLTRLALAWLVGEGLASLVAFLYMVAVGAPGVGVAVPEAALLAFLVLARARRRGDATRTARTAPEPNVSMLGRALATCLAVAVVASAARLVALSVRAPHGDWDAWAIWNLRARFLYRAGAAWERTFVGMPDWSHPDYPLLLPLSTVRGWAYLGAESPLVPALLAVLATASAATLLYGALREARGAPQAALATVLLVAPRAFVASGASQYADVHVSGFLLGAMVALHHHDRSAAGTGRSRALVLGGAVAALAAWTKNEGWLYLAALGVARFASMWPASARAAAREGALLAAGVLPVLAVVLAFKVGLAPPNDLVAGQGAAVTLSRLLEPARYAVIARALARELLHPLSWAGLVPLLAAYAWLVGRRESGPGDRATVRTGAVALALSGVGLLLVYVTTPRDLAWHLSTSLDRLLVQLWPATLFVLFLSLREPGVRVTGGRPVPSPGSPAPPE